MGSSCTKSGSLIEYLVNCSLLEDENNPDSLYSEQDYQFPDHALEISNLSGRCTYGLTETSNVGKGGVRHTSSVNCAILGDEYDSM